MFNFAPEPVEKMVFYNRLVPFGHFRQKIAVQEKDMMWQFCFVKLDKRFGVGMLIGRNNGQV